MSPAIDLHVHSCRSHDGSATVQEWCERAVALGLRVIGFSEHVDLDETDACLEPLDFDAYRAEVESAQAEFAGRLHVRLGVEVGYMPRIEPVIADWLRDRPVDYVIGSVHTIFENAGISAEYDALETFARFDLWEAYEEYFESLWSLVKSGLFDIVGHFDLIQRYGVHYQKQEIEWGRLYAPIIRSFEGMNLRQMALEINSSGLRQSPKSCYPDRKLLRLYAELGGHAVTLGSAAHHPEQLAAGLDVAANLAREFGLRLVDYSCRQAEPLL